MMEVIELDFNGFVFPTTERVVVEEVKEDGSFEKKSVFKFGRCR